MKKLVLFLTFASATANADVYYQNDSKVPVSVRLSVIDRLNQVCPAVVNPGDLFELNSDIKVVQRNGGEVSYYSTIFTYSANPRSVVKNHLFLVTEVTKTETKIVYSESSNGDCTNI